LKRKVNIEIKPCVEKWEIATEQSCAVDEQNNKTEIFPCNAMFIKLHKLNLAFLEDWLARQ
jgi:hypothetical protein